MAGWRCRMCRMRRCAGGCCRTVRFWITRSPLRSRMENEIRRPRKPSNASAVDSKHQTEKPGALARLFSSFPMKTSRLLFAFGLALAPMLRAELKLPAIIADHMVLQQKLANPIWGWDTPGTKVTVTFAGQVHTATAGADGNRPGHPPPQPAQPQTPTAPS